MARASARVPLVVQALWWRRGVSLVTLVVAALTVAAAAIAPIYSRAAAESVLRDRLSTAAPEDVGVSVEGTVATGDPTATADALASFPVAGQTPWYPRRILAFGVISQTGVTTPEPAGSRVATQVFWRDDVCAHLVIVDGRCPARAGEIAVSARTSEERPEWSLGARAPLEELPTATVAADGSTTTAPIVGEVVGIYRPRSTADPYWFGRTYFNAHPYTGRGEGPDTVDAFVTDRATFDRLAPSADATVTADYPLDPSAVRLADVPALRGTLGSIRTGPAAEAGYEVRSSLDAVLDSTEQEVALLTVAALVVSVQLALLAAVVLFQVVADTTEARGNEIALAKLRGLPSRSTVLVGLAEPLVLLVAAIPLGLGVAWVTSAAMTRVFLLPGTPVAVPLGAGIAVVLALLGGGTAAALAARRTLTRPVLEQWTSGASVSDRSGRRLLLLDLAVAGTSLAGFALLSTLTPAAAPYASAAADATTGVAGVLVLLAPGLLVVAVALLGVRLVPVVGRLGLRPTRAGRRVGLFLALRQVVRRPAGVRLAALLAVALGLATFAVGAESVATTNRDARAALELGATQVLDVSFERRHDPVEITRRVDPEGRWSMAVAAWLPYGGDVTGTVLGVDSARLDAVARWDAVGSPTSAPDVTARIAPELPPPVTITADAVRVVLEEVSFTGTAPVVTVLVSDDAGYHLLVAGPLVPGTGTYQAAAPCLAGCQLLQIGLDRRHVRDSPFRGRLVYARMDERRDGSWRPVDAGFGVPGAWRPTPLAGIPSPNHLTVRNGQLHDDVATIGSETPSIQHADAPLPLPALATPGSTRQEDPEAPPTMEDSRGRVIPLDLVERPDRLPVVGADGVLVDLGNLRTVALGSETESRWSVWLGDQAPPDAVARLTAAGLLVNSTASIADREGLLSRQGPALSLRLLLVCAAAGAALSAGAVAVAVAVTGRRRSFELAALGAVGVPRRQLMAACVGEQGLLLGAGLLVGVPAGVVAARLSLSLIPQFADPTPALLTLTPGVAPVVILTVVAGVLVAATAWIAGVAVLRASVPARLREADQ